ncbi:MAG TPA: hypothetical protein VFL57_01630 [Bryobacteraceae bacterium]|nr:hypothetical protein [Bryobacteraceae bacterium]
MITRDIVLHVFYLLCGIYSYTVYAFDRSRQRAPWARWLFLAAGCSLVIRAACGFAIDFHVWPPVLARCLRDLKSLVGGFIVGLLFALIVSGELTGKKVVKDEVAA